MEMGLGGEVTPYFASLNTGSFWRVCAGNVVSALRHVVCRSKENELVIVECRRWRVWRVRC